MKVVWRHQRATVRDVYETIRKTRSIAYTTIMTMMRILEEKGHLKKSLVDRAHVYTSSAPRQQAVTALVREFLDRVFDGTPDALLLHLAKDNTLTSAQRRLIKQVLENADE